MLISSSIHLLSQCDFATILIFFPKMKAMEERTSRIEQSMLQVTAALTALNASLNRDASQTSSGAGGLAGSERVHSSGGADEEGDFTTKDDQDFSQVTLLSVGPKAGISANTK